jgi:hypothetical protein
MSLSDVFSFVSSSAVILTLIFLLLQMRQTNKNQKALMQQGRASRWIDIILNRTEPTVSEAISRAMLCDMTMDGAQVQTAVIHFCALFWSAEDSYLQHKAGLLDEGSWATEIETLRANLSVPTVRVSWKMNRAAFNTEYCAYVDSLLQQTKPIKRIDQLARWKDMMAQELAEPA